MIKEPLLRNLSFEEILTEIELSYPHDPLYQALNTRWNENQEELQEEVTDLRNECQSLSDERDDLEANLDCKGGYMRWASKFASHVIKNATWEFVKSEEKDSDSNFVFENYYNISYGGWGFENRNEIYTFNASLIVSHGDTTQIHVSMNTIYHTEVLNYEKPVTEEVALQDAKAILVKFIFERVEYE